MNTKTINPRIPFPIRERTRIFITGGTLDALAIMPNGNYVFGETHIPEMLTQGRIKKGTVRYDVLMMKDSDNLKDWDREIILKNCRASKEKRILITHGTNTMIQTGAYLHRGFATEGFKTIVLVGAMVPFNRPNSDALFNFGFGLTAAQLLPHGIYIAMNGRIFDWSNIRKNRKLQAFETLDGR